jgi:quercetin dioxygenase-like cupin family protein
LVKQLHRAGEDVITSLFPGARVQFVHGESMTVAIWEFDENSKVSTHAHPAEQITHCSKGILELRIADEVVVLQPGDTVAIPGGVAHSARAQTAAKGFDSFHPVREDYRF